MTRSSRFVLAAFVVLAAAGGAGAQQQWGPPAQSKLYHDASHTPTYMGYNTSIQPHTTAAAPSSAAERTVVPAKPAVRRRVATRRPSNSQ